MAWWDVIDQFLPSDLPDVCLSNDSGSPDVLNLLSFHSVYDCYSYIEESKVNCQWVWAETISKCAM